MLWRRWFPNLRRILTTFSHLPNNHQMGPRHQLEAGLLGWTHQGGRWSLSLRSRTYICILRYVIPLWSMDFCKLTSGLDQKLSRYLGNKHLDNMANCPAKAAYGFMDLDKRTAKWDSRVIYWAENFVLLQVLQHPFENEGRPLPFNWGYWLNPGEWNVLSIPYFHAMFLNLRLRDL